MVLGISLNFVFAAGVTFVVIFLMTPFLYEMWFDHLRPDNNSRYAEIGDNIFGSFQIMAYIVPGVIILWGFAVGQRQRVREESF